jgi:DHA1 family bicyclomycin/chloramphenicol resistance-like MFS transporter
MTLVGAFTNGTAMPMVAGIGACSAGALVLAHTALRPTQVSEAVTGQR